MKLGFLDAAGHPGNQHSGFGERAFTLNEVMVAMAILLMAVAGVMMCQWFGMIMTERTRGKVDANDRARHFLAQINSEIGSAKNVLIGTGSSTTFVPVGANLLQQGNAIQINSSTNTNQFIRYYRDAADQTVKRLTDQTSSPSIVASGVTNGLVFTAQDFTGTTLTNSQGNCVIGGTLNINELRAAAKMGVSNSYYASYTLKARIALRTTP